MREPSVHLHHLAILMLLTFCISAMSAESIDFARDIKPLFEKRCISCHGPEKQKAGYRLDIRSVALKGAKSETPVIVPGSSGKSLLYQLVSGADPDSVMPPKGERLNSADVAKIQAWIDEGAKWPDAIANEAALESWSLKALETTPVTQPPAELAGWVRNGVDAFVAQKLAEKKMHPAKEADKRTLVRRVYFDLTGLPPTPAEIAEFINNNAPDAYENLIRKLLDSPRYGERWARHWLDVVHYGETHGYDKDQPRRNAWPYRDYVIRAFNTDKPYARFVQEQLAGDVLFPGTVDGYEALGFISAGPWDLIGHSELPETKIDGMIARHLDRDDMISNTMNTFNSLTVQCAQCHNHKFDPIKQEDYYSLQAVFSALDRADRHFDIDPAVATRRRELSARIKELDKNKETINAEMKKKVGPKLDELNKQIAAAEQAAVVKQRVEYGYHSALATDANTAKWVQVDLGKPTRIGKVAFAGTWDEFNHIGVGFGFPKRYKIEASDDPNMAANVVMLADQTAQDVLNPGSALNTIEFPETAARYVRFTATRLATRQNDYMLALAEISVFDPAKVQIPVSSVTALDTIEAAPRWSTRNVIDGYAPLERQVVADLRKKLETAMEENVPADSRTKLAQLDTELQAARSEVGKLPPERIVYAGGIYSGYGNFVGTGSSGGKPRVIHVLKRGDVKNPAQEVAPGALNLIKALPGKFDLPPEHTEGDRRAALAKWISDTRNPLTWRSIVNRVWLYHFGRGLSDTPNDFGRMGQTPSHPELLNWLAANFRDGKQSFKELHYLLMTSATYRQANENAPEFAKVDSDNVYYWKMNKRKLEAEAIRDSILYVSGKLDFKMGGPSFDDFKVEHPEHSPHYEYQLYNPEDPSTHRRSIYRFIVRSKQQPFLATFDCADPSMLVDKRNQTITPLQALALYNDDFVLTMAKHFAQRVGQSPGPLEAQMKSAFEMAFGSEPAVSELKMLVEYAQQHGLPNACRVLFNLNRFVFVD